MVIASALRRCGLAAVLHGLFALAGCGECVFEMEVTGVVVDAEGEPMAGVEVRSCLGQGCAIAEDDDACVRSITDEEGRFTLEVPQCRLEPHKCELRPLLLGREGCSEESARVEPAAEERVITFRCDP
jgi:hypothetical protein